MTLGSLRRDGAGDVVVFLHGLGCVKENFVPVWDAVDFDGVTLLAPDLPGHGASHGGQPPDWTMQGMADCVAELLEEQALKNQPVHLVAHSMGGAVGLLLAQNRDLRIASFTNVEGNLIASDCGLLSRRTAGMDLDAFVGGKFDKLKASAFRSEDPVVREWAGWMDTCDAEGLHACARSVVEWSDSGRLLDMFLRLTVPRSYVYGDASANPDVLAQLGAVQTHEIADCGHFVMSEKPAELARVIGNALTRASR